MRKTEVLPKTIVFGRTKKTATKLNRFQRSINVVENCFTEVTLENFCLKHDISTATSLFLFTTRQFPQCNSMLGELTIKVFGNCGAGRLQKSDRSRRRKSTSICEITY